MSQRASTSPPIREPRTRGLAVWACLALSTACAESESGGADDGGRPAPILPDGGGTAPASGAPGPNDDGAAGDGATSSPSTPVGEPDAGGGGDCDDAALLCDGTTVVEIDQCTLETRSIEECEQSCYQGRCVDCVPLSGVVCAGDDVHELDSCGVLGVLVEECTRGCAAGRCVEDDCESRDHLECLEDLVVAVDSCGNPGNVEQTCTGACVDGTCEGCADEGATTCFDGDIYGLDSCGQIGSRVDICPETCSNDGGVTTCVDDEVCSASESIACALGDIHTVDSCGNVLAEIVEECPNGCDENGCIPCSPRPIGTQCLNSSIYRLIGGCDDPATPEDTPLEVCEFGCSAGDCLESECVPGAGRRCDDGNVHEVDSCNALGELVETCAAGCAEGDCLPEPGPPSGGTGGAPSDAGNGGNGGASDAGPAVSGGGLDAGPVAPDAGDASFEPPTLR
jgi:hypothetical protein